MQLILTKTLNCKHMEITKVIYISGVVSFVLLRAWERVL